ncbi:MAG: aldehyde dehydrogenase [Spirochaetes bacterium RBG_13_51_14]|nr:MAG: aldehyde dehydrogenase [Spirochaetes bacterium RBG_13_51_14]
MNSAHTLQKKHRYITPQQHITKDTILLRALLQKNREFFETGKTRDVVFRITQLKMLKTAIKANRDIILKTLWDDLKKPPSEAYAAEIGLVNHEIEYAIAHVKRWVKGRKAGTPRSLSPAKSMIMPEPYGMVLIIGPWNYPFQLILAPLVGAIAAGNTAVLKPSELAPHSSQALADMIGSTFDREYISVVQGGIDTAQDILGEKFDYLFFTGGAKTGKIIMSAAAQHLTPVTLELGGKSPVIVDRSASIDLAAKKIVWGKFINTGQTCLAPDYLLVHRDVKDALLDRIKQYIREFYGENPKLSKHYGRIISQKHFHRLSRILRSGSRVIGGRTDESQLYIEPTVIDNVTMSQPIMQEEIFGPILPVMTFKSLENAASIVNSMPKPLALYLFTGSKESREYMIRNTSSGGVCVNDVVIHIGNYHLPFGGVGESGMGAYHGRTGFETFSHMKSVMIKPQNRDIPKRYPPHSKTGSIFRRTSSKG